MLHNNYLHHNSYIALFWKGYQTKIVRVMFPIGYGYCISNVEILPEIEYAMDSDLALVVFFSTVFGTLHFPSSL